ANPPRTRATRDAARTRTRAAWARRSGGLGSTGIASSDQLGGRRELLIGQDGHGSVAASQIASADRLLLARVEVGQRVQARAPVVAFFGEPHLIAANQAITD